MKGILLLTLWKSSSVSSTRAVTAIARRCRTAFVLPPNAIVITKAFSKDCFVRRFRGLIFFSMHTLIASAAFIHSLFFAGATAGVDEEPGRVKPIDSIAVAIVFAVYMP